MKLKSLRFGELQLIRRTCCCQVLNFVRVAVQFHKVNLVSMDREVGNDVLVYELPVDSRLQQFTISVSGENPHVSIIDPQGRSFSRSIAVYKQ